MKLGDVEIHVLSGGKYWLDGGTMYGVVPKVLWEKKSPADEKNRIELETNCPLIRVEDKWVLVDTGCGSKFGDKEKSIYRLDKEDGLVQSLSRFGLKPEDIDTVIATHLHFDHIGGGTAYDSQGKLVPTFPNARYIFQKGEWEAALSNYGVMTRTYLKENLIPLEEAKVIEFVDGDKEILPGLSVVKTGGHTRDHQIVQLNSKEKKGVFFGDLIPTHCHLPYAWIMAYDLFPVETLKVKKELLKKVVEERWLVLWDHDPRIPAGYVSEKEMGKFEVTPVEPDEVR